MSRIAKTILFDKDIRELKPKEKKYRVVVGNPSELILFVYPSGTKTFALRLRNGNKEKNIPLKRFRQGIYSVAEARKEATEKLRIIESGGELDTDKYLFKNLYKDFIAQKRKKGQTQRTIRVVENLCNRHLLPHFGHLDAREIKYSNILSVFNTIFDSNNPRLPRLETIKRAKTALRNILAPALKDRYIEYDPTLGLEKEFPSIKRYYIDNDIDPRLAALTKENDLREFLQDLSAAHIEKQIKRALYLQILCVNRPANTAGSKWQHIDLETKVWSIPAKEMKMREPFTIALSKEGHIHRDTLSKALRRLNKGKWQGKVTTHGFRATFRTICTLHKAELLQMGISDEVIEVCLAHKETNSIKYAYEREKSTLQQQRILMQWYGDYLNALCDFKL
ncbi:site-specific integrase [Helicobacter sp. MIT 03-1614]|uniref:tyrosine-type recombinase/integrase n=1 Tax=Helicobacter sp. MIT 03-1614 TaxID=1548147 RepID=UPI000513461B|nr:site-specific integrase [Helicobacter sp. MIT 03-1614]TLD89049.1 site-specific integrase [Helicobacter sp. MIT 03-1614]